MNKHEKQFSEAKFARPIATPCTATLRRSDPSSAFYGKERAHVKESGSGAKAHAA
jgi:hypothetical protein